MKQIILKQTKYALGLVAALALPSCAEKKDNNANADDPAPKEEKEKKVDTPAGLTDELVVQMNVFADVMGTVKDKASAEEAVKKINGVCDAFEAIAVRLDKLETPSEEENHSLEEKMNKASEAMTQKIMASMGALQGNAEAGAVIVPALDEFSKRMEKLKPILDRFGMKEDEVKH